MLLVTFFACAKKVTKESTPRSPGLRLPSLHGFFTPENSLRSAGFRGPRLFQHSVEDFGIEFLEK